MSRNAIFGSCIMTGFMDLAFSRCTSAKIRAAGWYPMSLLCVVKPVGATSSPGNADTGSYCRLLDRYRWELLRTVEGNLEEILARAAAKQLEVRPKVVDLISMQNTHLPRTTQFLSSAIVEIDCAENVIRGSIQGKTSRKTERTVRIPMHRSQDPTVHQPSPHLSPILLKMSPSPVFTLTLTLTSNAKSAQTATVSQSTTKTKTFASPSIIATLSTLTRTFKRKSKAPSPAATASKCASSPLTPAEAYAIMEAEGRTGRYPPFASRNLIARAHLSEKKEEKEPQMTLEHTIPATSTRRPPILQELSHMDRITQLQDEIQQLPTIMSSPIAYLTSRANFVQVSADVPITKQRNATTNKKELVTDLIVKAKQVVYLIKSLPEPEPEEEQAKRLLQLLDEEMAIVNEQYISAVARAKNLHAQITEVLRIMLEDTNTGIEEEPR
ncbi:hypothetical protein DFH06DRAFT_1304221 [Mycena polygramma]|nr:hypothetical protein DFH06DRAFT_1304221 [Mycena polygramma]